VKPVAEAGFVAKAQHRTQCGGGILVSISLNLTDVAKPAQSVLEQDPGSGKVGIDTNGLAVQLRP
jgi:hypothetical protein